MQQYVLATNLATGLHQLAIAKTHVVGHIKRHKTNLILQLIKTFVVKTP